MDMITHLLSILLEYHLSSLHWHLKIFWGVHLWMVEWKNVSASNHHTKSFSFVSHSPVFSSTFLHQIEQGNPPPLWPRPPLPPETNADHGINTPKPKKPPLLPFLSLPCHQTLVRIQCLSALTPWERSDCMYSRFYLSELSASYKQFSESSYTQFSQATSKSSENYQFPLALFWSLRLALNLNQFLYCSTLNFDHLNMLDVCC